MIYTTMALSGGIEDDDNIPSLVEAPSDSDDEDYFFPSARKYRKVPGKFPWKSEAACLQSNFSTQAARWVKLDDSAQTSAVDAVQRLLVTPFLFQQLCIPEKWIRWAADKDFLAYDVTKGTLPAGKIPRHHYLVVKMFKSSIEKLKTLIDKKKTVAAIMKMMHSIRNVSIKDVEKAIKDTKTNENVKILVEFIKSEVKNFSESDRNFFEAVDRISLTVLMCMRQFAEVVHIITCEGRDISVEVRNQFSDHFYYLHEDHKIGREKGNEFFQKGKFQDAINAYTEAINKAPFHYVLYSNRCQASIKMSDYESAFADAYRTVVLKPSWAKGFYEMALCLGELGYLEEALGWGKDGLTISKDDATAKSLRELLEHITSKMAPQKSSTVQNDVEPPTNTQPTTEGKKKAGKSRKKKKGKTRKEENDFNDLPELISDDEFEECPVIADKVKKDEEAEKRKEEQRKKDEKERKLREEKDRRERAILKEYEQNLQKGASEFLESRYADACKSYALAIDMIDTHKQIRSYTENDFATVLYARGVASQNQGSPVEIDTSRQYFLRIINEHKMFSHLGMAHYANAKSTYLLNNFDLAMKQVSTALQMVKKFPVHGRLTWPGSSENIPESDENYLRKEIHVLLQQCKLPPIPSGMCQYEACLKDYSKKQIYITDLNFEGYFEVRCDWRCVFSFHLRCWAKFKHDRLNVSGDKDVLGIPCITPDCQGKIVFIRMLDEHVMEKKVVKSTQEQKTKNVKIKTANSGCRMSKSERNLKKFQEKREEKRRKQGEVSTSSSNDHSSTQASKSRNQRQSENYILDERDVSEATIYVKNDNSQKTNGNSSQGRVGRRVVPASLEMYCFTLPGYSKDMPVKVLSETIQRAKNNGVTFVLPDDLRDEIEQLAVSLSDDEPVVFTNDEKIKIPFLLEYFVNFLSENGPLDSTSDLFTDQLLVLPNDMRIIIGKCGGLVAFLSSSPLFIQVPPYIGVHSQHQNMKKLTEAPIQRNHVTILQNSPVDIGNFLDYEEFGLSQFAKEFYQVGADVADDDIINLTGAVSEAASSYGQGNMYELDEVPPQRRLKSSQNSETSSMYSLDDIAEIKSDLTSQTSFDSEKCQAAGPRPSTPQKKQNPTSIPQQLKKQIPKKKFSTAGTQTEGRDEAEKAKEAVARLQERLKEMQDDYTKLKRTSQTREEALMKDLEAANEREQVAIAEKESMRQTAENELAKIPQYKKQVQVAESKMEQSRLKEQELEVKLSSLTAGMQSEREEHLKEILTLRKSLETMNTQSETSRQRAIAAEVELTRTKEAYHVGAHMQAKSHCEQGVREFDIELVRLASVLPEHIMTHFKHARKQWVDSVVACGKTVETLKAAYESIIEQINAGRPLSELPPVPDLKPPPPGPNPRHMMIQLQRNEGALSMASKQQPVNGSGDGNSAGSNIAVGSNNIAKQSVNGTSSRSSPNLAAISQQANPPPLPVVTAPRNPAPVVKTAPQQPPIGSELPRPPRKKNFLQLVDKLCKNLPQLTRAQVEESAQRVRAENKGLTGLLYEEIEKRIREMNSIDKPPRNQPVRKPGPSAVPPTPAPSIWKIGPSMLSSRESADFFELDDEAVCPICCDPLKDGKIHTLECLHKFHYDCIQKWMKKQRTCPNCRKFMADTSEFPSLGSEAPPGLLRNHHQN